MAKHWGLRQQGPGRAVSLLPILSRGLHQGWVDEWVDGSADLPSGRKARSLVTQSHKQTYQTPGGYIAIPELRPFLL